MANKLTAQVYNNKGKSVRSLDLPENLFGLSWNADMMHQVITGMQSNRRSGTAHTKGRGEVSGGGKKPWRQKGTGRARHGSSRSPIWIGGGTTHGPLKDKSYDKKINKKTRQKALFVALSEKLRSGHLLFVDAITSSGKTKEVADALKGLSSVDGFKTLCTRKSNNILVLSGDLNATTKRAFKNISFATVDPAIGANALDVMKYRYVLVSNPDEALKAWSAKGVSRTVKAVEKKAAKKALRAEKAAQPKKEKTEKKGRAKKTEVKTS